MLFAALGERLKIRQYRILDEAVTATPEFKRSIADVELASIWGTRSGVRIGKLENPDAARNARRVLFKQGDPSKLQRERDSLERWVKIAPGLVPEVVEFQQEHQEGAALLLQYLDGATLQDLTLNAETPVLATGARPPDRDAHRPLDPHTRRPARQRRVPRPTAPPPG